MRQLLLIPACLSLVACDKAIEDYCDKTFLPVECVSKSILDEGIFELCLSKVAEARSSKGGDYTTNDDEDLHHAIKACSHAASPYYRYQKECKPNPEYEAQQLMCSKKENE